MGKKLFAIAGCSVLGILLCVAVLRLMHTSSELAMRPKLEQSQSSLFSRAFRADKMSDVSLKHDKYYVLDSLISEQCSSECRCGAIVTISGLFDKRLFCVLWIDNDSVVQKVLLASKSSAEAVDKTNLHNRAQTLLDKPLDRERLASISEWSHTAPLYETTLVGETAQFRSGKGVRKTRPAALFFKQDTMVNGSNPLSGGWLYWEADAQGVILDRGVNGS